MKRILLVDDDYSSQRIMELIVHNEFKDVELDQSFEPFSAMTKVEKNGYDAILVDYKLPQMSGVDFIKRIQEKTHAPIYIVSMYDKDLIQKEVVNAGVDIAGIIPKNNLFQNVKHFFENLS